MTAYKIEAEYSYVLDVNEWEPHQQFTTIVLGENIGDAFSKVLQTIAAREIKKHQKLVDQAKQANVYPPQQKEVTITKMNLAKIYENVIQ